MVSRKRLEEIEDNTLAPYGMHADRSKGRAYPDHEPDYRLAYQRDRDRILHTTAFRRLEYKTQVFVFSEGDYYRTRLTHTLEVIQIGRTLARALGANEDLSEAICMAHDLGHPPFGHSGERALARLTADSGGFNHNSHSFRIVTELEKRYAGFPGLNLTWEVREGIVKHETDYDVPESAGFDPALRASLEAQIANAADELAYTAHDLDDGLRSGMIGANALAGVALWERITQQVGWRGGAFDELTRHEVIRELIGFEITSLLDSTSRAIEESGVRTPEDVQRLDHNLVAYTPQLDAENRQLREFLFKNLYRHPRVVRMAQKAERIVAELFKAYRAEPAILPEHIQELIPERGLERTICDYIAGMTDRFAVEEHRKLFDPQVLP